MLWSQVTIRDKFRRATVKADNQQFTGTVFFQQGSDIPILRVGRILHAFNGPWEVTFNEVEGSTTGVG